MDNRSPKQYVMLLVTIVTPCLFPGGFVATCPDIHIYSIINVEHYSYLTCSWS